jgi:hypothetical protein
VRRDDAGAFLSLDASNDAPLALGPVDSHRAHDREAETPVTGRVTRTAPGSSLEPGALLLCSRHGRHHNTRAAGPAGVTSSISLR